MVKDEGIEDLLLLYYEGVTTEEESLQVEEWLAASEENLRMARQIQIISLAAGMGRVLPKLDVKKALANTHRKMNLKETGKHQTLWRGMQRVAAILFVPLVVAWCVLYFSKDEGAVQTMEVKTNPGMTTSLELPDGTKVILNSASSLRYPSRFSKEKREVELTGEAFFSVTKGTNTFVVNVLNGSEIVVHGTEFNVEAYHENETVQATLVSGKVSFSYLDSGKKRSLTMQPGQKMIYDIARKQVSVQRANIDVETGWKDGRLVFKNTPFEEVLASLSKRYNVEFILKNSALKQNSFTATFTKQRLERILEYFRISSNMRFKFIENGDISVERQVIEVY